MNTTRPIKHVITGGPGFGKTTLIQWLVAKGYKSTPESSRTLIQEILARNGTELPWLDRLGFQELILPRRIEDYVSANEPETYFFDRGLPDEIAYYKKDGLEPSAACLEACAAYRYDTVFVVPPWEEIHKKDAERRESFEEAVRIHEAIVEAYRDSGYTPIEIPKDTLENRLKFVLANI